MIHGSGMNPYLYKNFKGWFDFEEIYDSAVRLTWCETIVEIGFGWGRSGCYLCELIDRCHDGSRPAPVIIDPMCHLPGQMDSYFELLRTLANHGITGPELIIGTSHNVAQQWLSGPVARARPEFVFIDGDHRYNAVYQDLCDWWDLLAPGGHLAGHDYLDHKHCPEVKPAVDDWAKKMGLDFVVRGTSFQFEVKQ